jgi:hypothetical protein
VLDISKWFEASSTEQDSHGILRHLDVLLKRLTSSTAPAREEPRATGPVGTVPDPEHPDAPVNSL